eukprot:TRINITY_DN20402_c0_g1_i1.p2 TRINITY_DN20402_c0_g1~~TRINITY_DN20402_c0_g1_i1.p2  ORF type:complete len:204 (-),score=-7.49 TRINITY_DN20402_c0_g1_i1:199-810(-)
MNIFDASRIFTLHFVLKSVLYLFVFRLLIQYSHFINRVNCNILLNQMNKLCRCHVALQKIQWGGGDLNSFLKYDIGDAVKLKIYIALGKSLNQYCTFLDQGNLVKDVCNISFVLVQVGFLEDFFLGCNQFCQQKNKIFNFLLGCFYQNICVIAGIFLLFQYFLRFFYRYIYKLRTQQIFFISMIFIILFFKSIIKKCFERVEC